MNAVSISHLQELKRQELVANDRLRAAKILKSCVTLIEMRSEVSRISSASLVRPL